MGPKIHRFFLHTDQCGIHTGGMVSIRTILTGATNGYSMTQLKNVALGSVFESMANPAGLKMPG